MRRLLILLLAIITANACATIINIPDDYTTIQAGIDVSTEGDTVLVQPGAYVEDINFNGHNIVLGSLFITTGDQSYIEQTDIDGNYSGTVVTFESGEDSTTIISGFTIRNGNSEQGGGIHCENSNPLICNNIIFGNISSSIFGGKGGGIYCQNANPVINNNLIMGNEASNHEYDYFDYGGGIYCESSNAIIKNNLIIGNSVFWGYGGGIHFQSCYGLKIINNTIIFNNWFGLNCSHSNPIVKNNIIWGNTSGEIFGNLPLTYCDINGGWAGEGNIDLDPLFRDPDNGDFHLMAIDCGDPFNSPCIDMGHPDILDSLLDCDWGLGGLRSDMGAYGGGDSVGVSIDDIIKQLPKRISLFQNYPNPFNASTMIKYELPQQSQVTIDIYDIFGRKVNTLIDRQQPAGYYQAIWRADDFSSGMYFYRLQAGDYIEAKKMLLLK